MVMDYDKVLTPFSKATEDYIGWEGYGGNDPCDLDLNIRGKSLVILEGFDSYGNFICREKGSDSKTTYSFFYPVELKPGWRPYRNLTEMAEEMNRLEDRGRWLDDCQLAELLLGKVLRTVEGRMYRIGGFDSFNNMVLAGIS